MVYEDGALSDRYLWSDGVNQLLAQEVVTPSASDTNLVVWTLTDHLGSVRDQVGTASLVSHQVYDAFGNLVETDNGNVAATDMRFGYTGRAYDEETGLQNNHHRWYDATTGRWLSQDPIGFAAGDANLYRYVGNQPTALTDPSGLEPAQTEP